jgi:hypothetical protein
MTTINFNTAPSVKLSNIIADYLKDNEMPILGSTKENIQQKIQEQFDEMAARMENAIPTLQSQDELSEFITNCIKDIDLAKETIRAVKMIVSIRLFQQTDKDHCDCYKEVESKYKNRWDNPEEVISSNADQLVASLKDENELSPSPEISAIIKDLLNKPSTQAFLQQQKQLMWTKYNEFLSHQSQVVQNKIGEHLESAWQGALDKLDMNKGPFVLAKGTINLQIETIDEASSTCFEHCFQTNYSLPKLERFYFSKIHG